MKTVLFIGLVFPEPNSSAAGTRIIQLIHLFQAQNYKVLFASSAQKSDFTFDLASIDVETIAIELNNSSFDDYIKQANPNIVVFDRFIAEEQFGWRVTESCPNAIRILDTEDLHCLRYARQKAVKKSEDFQMADLLNEPSSFREIASIYRCDLTLMISDFEMTVLTDFFKIDSKLLCYLPLFYEAKNDVIPYDDRKDFVFIGNFIHDPNYDAVLQLKNLWKSIKKQLPDTELHIYGAYPSAKVFQLHNENEGFLIKGRAKDAYEVIENAKVLLAPLRFGAGIKGKLLEAMVVGTPSVTTANGQEGIATTHWNGSVTNQMNEFVTNAIEIYTNKTLWEQCQKIGFEILKHKFEKSLYSLDFSKKISLLSQNLLIHRKNNFIGNLLYQNQFASQKFMSKWIEEKNKL